MSSASLIADTSLRSVSELHMGRSWMGIDKLRRFHAGWEIERHLRQTLLLRRLLGNCYRRLHSGLHRQRHQSAHRRIGAAWLRCSRTNIIQLRAGRAGPGTPSLRSEWLHLLDDVPLCGNGALHRSIVDRKHFQWLARDILRDSGAWYA